VANAGFDLLDDRRKVSLCAVVAAASSVRLRFTDWLWKGGALSDATGYDLRLRFGEAVAKSGRLSWVARKELCRVERRGKRYERSFAEASPVSQKSSRARRNSLLSAATPMLDLAKENAIPLQM
jgi:hypothetical protein